jgi:hypothetical protein
LSTDVNVREYDFGVCPQTGYRDAGERFRCLACGAAGDADDLVSADDAYLVQSTRCEAGLGPRNALSAAGGPIAR